MKEKMSSRTTRFMRLRGRGAPLAAMVVALALVPALLAEPASAAPSRTASTATRSSTSSSPWHIQNTPVLRVKEGAFDGVSCTSATFCVAVGYQLDSSDSQAPLAEVWNGMNWRAMKGTTPAATEESELSGVTCVSASDCVAVGQADEGPLAESWNGTSWTIANIPTTALFAYFDGVSCVSADHCMAVGTALEQVANELQEDAWAELWNGTSWTQTNTAKIRVVTERRARLGFLRFCRYLRCSW